MLSIGCTLLLLTGCSTSGNQFHCPVTPAYQANGSLDKTQYQVEVGCYKAMNKKMTACYKEAE